MIITTTPSVEGRAIREYKGIVFGEVISGVNFMKDLGAGLRNFFGGRSACYEEELQKAREEALEMTKTGQAAGLSGSHPLGYIITDLENRFVPFVCFGMRRLVAPTEVMIYSVHSS